MQTTIFFCCIWQQLIILSLTLTHAHRHEYLLIMLSYVWSESLVLLNFCKGLSIEKLKYSVNVYLVLWFLTMQYSTYRNTSIGVLWNLEEHSTGIEVYGASYDSWILLLWSCTVLDNVSDKKHLAMLILLCMYFLCICQIYMCCTATYLLVYVCTT